MGLRIAYLCMESVFSVRCHRMKTAVRTVP